METQITNVVQAFANAKQYAIPSYQRNYVWTREDQWEPLWEDVRALATRSVTEGPDVRPHFLGTIITKQIGVRRFVSRWWVVDGQQRLTTLQILLKAACAAFTKRGLVRFSGVLSDCLTNTEAVAIEREDKYKIDPKNGDYRTFASIIDADESSAQISAGDSGLAACFAYFFRAVGEWLDAKPESDINDRARALSETIREKLRVVDIRLGESDNPHTIFEALNARGEPLTEWEKTKNYILSIAAGPDDPDGDRTNQTHLEAYDTEPYWNEIVSLQRFTGKRIDLFLFYFAQIELPARRRRVSGDSRMLPLRRDRLYREFRYVGEHDYRQDKDALEGMLGRMKRYAGIYKSIDKQEGFSPYALEVMRRRHVLNLNSLVPVFMELVSKLGTDGELDKVLRILDSYLMRRVALKARYSGFDRTAFGHVQALRDAEAGELGAVLMRRFLDSPWLERWPRDQEVVQHLKIGDSYQGIAAGRLRLLLGGIAQRMHDEKQPPPTNPFGLVDSVTVEHVAPRGWEQHWQDDLGVGTSEEARLRMDQIVHRIGNLTLVTQPMNSTLSANPWSYKAGLLWEDNLEMNRRLLGDMEGGIWDESEIDRRSSQLATYVNEIWPHAEVLAKELGLDVTVPDSESSLRQSVQDPSSGALTRRQRNAERYEQFWSHYAQRYAQDGVEATWRAPNQWIRRGSGNPDISLMFAADAVGIFLTKWHRADGGQEAWMESRRATIDRLVGTGKDASVSRAFDTHTPENWDAMCDWLHKWLGCFVEIVEDGSAAE